LCKENKYGGAKCYGSLGGGKGELWRKVVGGREPPFAQTYIKRPEKQKKGLLFKKSVNGGERR